MVELTDDDRATIFGALLGVANIFKGDKATENAELCRRRGLRAFETERDAAARVDEPVTG